MKPVTFIRLVHPSGRRTPGQISMPGDVADKAHALQEKGLSFEIDHLQSGEVSIGLIGQDHEGAPVVTDEEVVNNNPTAFEAGATALIERAHARHCGEAA